MEDEDDPFAAMLIMKSEEIDHEQAHNHQVSDEIHFDSDISIKMEQFNNQPFDHQSNINSGQEDSLMYTEDPDSFNIKQEFQDSDNYDGDQTQPETQDHSLMITSSDLQCVLDSPSPSQPKKKGKPIGRPKGVKNGTGKGPARASVSENKALPKMRPNVHQIKLSADQIEQLKKVESFGQPGVCFRIAPKLDNCKECKKFNNNRRMERKEIECRFYKFRKLRFVGDEIEVVGFLDPFKDPVEVDRNIWMASAEKNSRFKSLSVDDSRLILTHVGEQLCQLIEEEKVYYHKYKTEEKPIIWKRLIDGVIEICDLCSTTLFNFHFICTRCGLSLCIDCVKESEDNTFEIKCSDKARLIHSFEDLSLTQIIVDDCMEKLQTAFHETCQLWEIEHNCELMRNLPPIDRDTRRLVKNILLKTLTGKNVAGRELPQKFTVMEFDSSKLIAEKSLPIEPDDFLDADFSEYFAKFRNDSARPTICKPIKNVYGSRENVISISRSVSQATSEKLYPNTPHKWLCENKLLRLLEPLNPGNEKMFQEQWQRGQPVLVSNILGHLERELWIPQAFSEEFGKGMSDFINCATGKLVRNREISIFWDGFENVDKRLRDNDGKPMLLKLKDWPPDSDFKKIMPSRFEDIMKNLPINSYTNRVGDLNIVKYLPSCFIHPDLGPKGYFAYGSPFYLKEGTTNLHLDVSDAVNLMVYVGFPRDKQISIDDYIEQGLKAIVEADCDIANISRVVNYGEIPGAIWHIYEASDADRIRDFLIKIAQERGFRVADDHDVIHDQNWYLDGELRARLFKEYGAKAYSITQCLGDCIMLPAGTPHQVRNIFSCIKIAEDFVSPQQVGHCLNLSKQFRKLTNSHTNNEEKLNIKNVAFHSVKEAISMLNRLVAKTVAYYKTQALDKENLRLRHSVVPDRDSETRNELPPSSEPDMN